MKKDHTNQLQTNHTTGLRSTRIIPSQNHFGSPVTTFFPPITNTFSPPRLPTHYTSEPQLPGRIPYTATSPLPPPPSQQPVITIPRSALAPPPTSPSSGQMEGHAQSEMKLAGTSAFLVSLISFQKLLIQNMGGCEVIREAGMQRNVEKKKEGKQEFFFSIEKVNKSTAFACAFA